MQFKVGDLVVHPAHGVGRIVGLEEKRLLGEERLYYEVTTQKSTVWVPVEPEPATGIRPMTVKADLARYRSLLKSRPAVLNPDHRQRHLEIAERLREGSFRTLCEVVRDLTARSWLKPLSDADTVSLRKARESLCQEWAAAEGVPHAEAVTEIDELLQEARRKHMS
ncbi:MAG: hypothetical protein HY023_09185 [Chloroflexi bacterium]|nr:hypothetical protein [Chloroflexota bacterium]MBI3763018.1 hypothetical protein [Chloroflexota bacterium]